MSGLDQTKSSVSIVLICTARCRIPVSASTNQGVEKGDLSRYNVTEYNVTEESPSV